MNENGDLFKNFPTKGDREQLFEAFSILTDKFSRRIIIKAAGPDSPISINQFEDISQIAMVRYLHLLTHAGILKPSWDGRGVRKFHITPFGRDVASVIE
jgi:hypothetical protein